MKVKAAAKINLMLDILKRFENGYHSLFMIMQSVDLYDVINVEKNSNNEIFILWKILLLKKQKSF